MLEYKVVRTLTHNKMEIVLNELARDGWRVVTYRSFNLYGAHFALLQRES
jgi:sarcosine oxidase gamma subunit